MASHVNELAQAVIALETAVGTLGGLRVREQDGAPTTVPVHTITVSNGVVTDLGGGEVLLTIAATSTAVQLRSGEAVWTVPSSVAVGDIVRVTGNYSAGWASNVAIGNASGVLGVVVDKPTTTTATVAYGGEVTMAIAITAGTSYYLGVDGALITTPLDPIANAGSGLVHKKIGFGISSTKILLHPESEIVL